jgi:hypothetical protein
MKNSFYIAWAKRHATARYNLANSGILGCDLNDLPITTDDVALNGKNEEGYMRWSRFFGQQCCLEYKRHDYEKGIIKIKAESRTPDSSPAQI